MSARDALAALVGQRIPGGCDDCDAYQLVKLEAPGVYVVKVHHDATCPFYRARVGAAFRRLRGEGR